MYFLISIGKVLAFLSLCGLLHFHYTGRADAQSPPTERTEAPATSQLVGTIESAPFSGAVFDDGSGNQSFYRIYDRLPDGSQIVRVNSGSILVKRPDGEAYEMFVMGGKGPAVAPTIPSHLSPATPGKSPLQPAPHEPAQRRGRSGRQQTSIGGN